MKAYRNLMLSSLLLGVVLYPSVLRATDQWAIDTIVDGYRVGRYCSLDILHSGDPAIAYYDYTDLDLEYSWFESGQWWTETVDSEGDVGSYTSLACMPNGQPAISYIDKTNQDLKCAWFDGTQWQCVIVDEHADNGYTCLRQLPSGQLAISYAGEGGLKYAWYDDGLWLSVQVDATPIKGWQTSMTMIHGKPAIAYYDGVNRDLKLARLLGDVPSDPNQWYIESLDTQGDVGRYNSITASESGDPMVCYFDQTNRDLKYICTEASTFGLKTWSAPVIVDDEGDAGQYCSMALLNGASHPDLAGMPVISYFHKAEDQLRFAWFDGTQWHRYAVDSFGWVGRHTSLKILDSGEPAVCYNRQNHVTSVRYAVFNGFGWQTDTVATEQIAGHYANLGTVASGAPAVSYRNVTNRALEFTWFDGQIWHTETIDDEGDAGYWISQRLVHGQPAISFQTSQGGWKLKYGWYDGSQWQAEIVDAAPNTGAYTSLAVSPVDQLPRISYTGNDDLRYAYHDGVTWHAGIVIDGDGDVGYYTSLAFLPSGKPMISYWDRTNTNLKVAELQGTDESNPAHWITYTVDSVKHVGEWTSLAIWDNEPVISYYDNTNRHLKLAWRKNGIWQTTTLDAGARTGQNTSLAIVDGKPTVTYKSNGSLKYTVLTGSDPANPLDWQTSQVAPGSVRCSSHIDFGGQPAIAYFDDSSGDLNLAFGL